MIRITTTFRGRVQGVGFRATTAHCARGLAISGFVCNQSDGSVLCVAEGRLEDIEAFLDDVHHAMRSNIAAVESERSAATGEFKDFQVRRSPTKREA
ncbi:MAG: acylphosphatase [Phycisphaerae bacterium]|jgi:acylphosphatase|nr:acylphosphatase [Phycisphaerae bacterium]